MKQETKELIKWIKSNIVQPSKGDEFYEKWKEAMKLLENSLPEIEKRLCLGGYIQDKNGTPCCHGDKVKFKFSEKGFNTNWKDKYPNIMTGKLQWSTDTNSFAIIFGPNKNGYHWIDWTDLDYGPEWFEKMEK